MESITLVIAIIAGALVLTLRYDRAFAAYVASMLFYPSYLVFQLGVLNVSVARVAVTLLLLRCLADNRIRGKFHWSRLDTWVTFSIAVYCIIPLFSSYLPATKVLQNRSGFIMDTYFAYIAARLCINDYAARINFIKLAGILLIPLALIGIIESCTGWQPYLSLMQYCPWGTVININPRVDFFRAIGPFSHPIMFGASFVIFLPMIYCLRHEDGNWPKLAYILSGIAVIGVLTSMSSGPWMMAILVIVCLIIERFKYLAKPLITFIAFSCIVVSIISNRPLYHVIASYANPLGGSGWYRAKLIDLAIEHFGEWCFAGYGGQDPGWGPALGNNWTDITNNYIIIAVEDGILGVIAFCGVLAVSLMDICKSYAKTGNYKMKSWYWAMGSLIIVLIISFNTCIFSGRQIYCFIVLWGLSVHQSAGHQKQPVIKAEMTFYG